jgi:TonB family protein
MRAFALFLLLSSCGALFAQESNEKLRSNADKARATMERSTGTGAYTEDLPSYPGGPAGITAYLQREVNYPKDAWDAGVMGKVIISFVVEKTGAVDSVHVRRGVHPTLDQEAVRVISSMKGWTPGRMKGEPVPVKMTLPINFVIPEKELQRIQRKLAKKK